MIFLHVKPQPCKEQVTKRLQTSIQISSQSYQIQRT